MSMLIEFIIKFGIGYMIAQTVFHVNGVNLVSAIFSVIITIMVFTLIRMLGGPNDEDKSI